MIAALGAITLACGCSSTRNAAPNQSAAQPGVSSTNVASATITNPCTLLTQEEASAAIGERLGPGELRREGPVTRCRFAGANEHVLLLDVEPPATFEGLTHIPNVKLVSGIGDQAVWEHYQYGTFLHILRGGNLVTMGLPRNVATMTPAVEKAGKLIASRM